MITPYQFGAVGDGVTDDTQSINDWLSYITGGVGYVPNAVFLTGGEHQYQSNTTIYGEGTFKLKGGVAANTRLFCNCDQTGGNEGIVFEGIALDGNRSANGGITGLTGFRGSKVSSSVFRGLKLMGFTQHGFDFSAQNIDNLFEGNEISDFGTGSIGFGIVVLGDCHRNRMIGNVIKSSLQNVGIAIDDQSGGTGGVPCTSNVVQGNTILGSGIGIMVCGSHRNIISGNSVNGVGNFGVQVTPSTDAMNDAIGNVVDGNTFEIDVGVNAYGVIASGSGTRVTGNTVHGGQNGIYVQDTPNASMQSSDVLVQGNYCTQQSKDGIVIAGGKRVTVTGNQVTESGRRSINVAAIAPYLPMRSVKVNNNTCSKSQQVGIVVASNVAAPLQEVIVTDNLCIDGSQAQSGLYSAILVSQSTNALSKVRVKGNCSIATESVIWTRTVTVDGSPTQHELSENWAWGYTET